MNRIALLVFVAIACLGCSTHNEPTAKGSLFIIGGGSRPPAMIERIIAESGLKEGGYGIILPMSTSEQDSGAWYATRPFVEKGTTNIYGLPFYRHKPDSTKKPSDIEKEVYDHYFTAVRIDSIRNAKLIYISGGDQDVFMGIAGGTDVVKAIHDAYEKGAMIAGTSAGAAVMSDVMITGNELKNKDYSSTFRSIQPDNIETKKGLGLITTAIIDQHFVRRSRYNRLITGIIEFPELKGIGIDESTALFVKGNQCEVVGVSQIIVFENKSHSKIIKDEKLGVRGVEMSVYLPGDKFELR